MERSDAHSLYLETLGELGLVGLLLLAAFLFYPLRRAIASRRSPGVAAAAGAAVAFLAHAGVDWDWSRSAVVVAGLACLAAVLLAQQREDEVELARPARAGRSRPSPSPSGCARSRGGTASSLEPSASMPQRGYSAGPHLDLI